MQNQIIYFLSEKYTSKNQFTNLVLENNFKSEIFKVISYANSITLLTPNDDYQFPKRLSKIHHQKSSYYSYFHDNRFHALSVNRTIKITMKIYSSQSHQAKHKSEIDLIIGNSARKKIPVILLLGDSIVKR